MDDRELELQSLLMEAHALVQEYLACDDLSRSIDLAMQHAEVTEQADHIVMTRVWHARSMASVQDRRMKPRSAG